MAEADNQIVLACEIPEGATPGSTFHVQLNDRFFEVVTPDDAVPGQTINIVVPSEVSVAQGAIDAKDTKDARDARDAKDAKDSTSSFPEQLASLTSMGFSESDASAALTSTDGDLERATAVLTGEVKVGTVVNSNPIAGLADKFNAMAAIAATHAKNFDEKYRITDKIVEVATPAIEKLKNVDREYKVSEKASAVHENVKARITEIDEKYEISTKTNAMIAAGSQKIRDIDDQHKITERVVTTGENITAYAREIDGRYAVSATIARVVEKGIENIVSAYRRLTAHRAGGGGAVVVEEVEMPEASAVPVVAESKA